MTTFTLSATFSHCSPILHYLLLFQLLTLCSLPFLFLEATHGLTVSTCDTFLGRGIAHASAGNNLMLSLVGVIHFGRTVEHAQLNRHRSSDVTPDYKSAGKKKLSCHFPLVSRDDATEVHFWRNKSSQANFCSTRPFREELESWKSV
ncbi:hypothetical protein ILYODFUR_038522 [Ilyodon furcidens]|uniref:Secreted protein n=1 Tax=Ilyodon furcidens TaxID=33524 RepID=A0ABV0V0W4_9TELE